MKLKLFPKLALILTALAVIPVLIVGWQTYSLNKSHLETNILELQTNLANSLSARIDRNLRSLAAGSRSFIEILEAQGSINVSALQSFVQANPGIISVAYVNGAGREMIKASGAAYPDEKKLKDRSASPLFAAPLSADGRVRGSGEPGFHFAFENDEPRLAVLILHNPENAAQGGYYVVASLAELWKTIANEGAGVGGGGGRSAFVVDADGKVIAHSKNNALALERAAFAAHPIVAEALERMSIGSKEYLDDGGRAMVGAYAPVALTRWISVIEQPKEEAFYAIEATRRSAVRIILLSILAAALVAFFFTKTISRPVFALIEGAKKIAAGEFSHKVDVNTADEISDLARTFNDMTRELKRYHDLQVDRIVEEKTKTEAIIFSIEDGIVMTDRAGTIQLANDRAAQILGLEGGPGKAGPGGNWTGENLLRLVPDPSVKAAVGEILSRPESRALKEIVISDGGAARYYQLSSALVRVPHADKTLGVVAVVHDVTLERQLDQMKQNFLHSITHDLRNPMTSILGFVKFLRDGTGGAVTDAQKQMLATMERAGGRLLSMISDILDVAKIEAGKLEIRLEPVLVADVVANVLELNQVLVKRKNVELKADYPEGLDPKSLRLQADVNQMERLIGNLVANAVKFTGIDGKITVRVRDFPDKIQIAVADTGVGIPADYLDKVFDKFQQVRGQREGGTGLGLTISKYFVELHRGKIWVESVKGQGSTFTFWIPKGLKRAESGEIVIEGEPAARLT